MKTYKNIEIYELNNEGCGICRIDNKVTFIPYALKTEVIDLEITENNSKFNKGIIKNIVKESSYRKIPKCKYYYSCGGCNLMHLEYSEELKFKINKVINNFKHISNIELSNIDIVFCNEYFYRNHITLSVLNDNIGFFKNNSNEIVNIDKCIISNPKINETIKEIKKFLSKYKNNGIKKISIKSYNEILINIIGDFNLVNEFLSIVKCDSLYINDEYISGMKSITESIGTYNYNVSALSFFQKNTSMTEKLYNHIKTLVNTNDKVLDLYCGVGSIGIYIASNCSSVIGIEIIEDAIVNAKENSKLNNISNIKFISGRVEDNIDKFSDINTIIVDPPRIGLSKSVIKSILNIKPDKIIYISCDSHTLARDINSLKDIYSIESVKLFDLFPNTHHVETVVVLKENKEA